MSEAALINLLKAGYTFSEEQIAAFSTVEGSRRYTKRSLPLFWVLKGGESRATCEKAVREIKQAFPDIKIAVGGKAFESTDDIWKKWPVDIYSKDARELLAKANELCA